MEKRRVPDSAREAREQSGLSERMRQLILRSSTVEERRIAAGDNAERRRRTDDNGDNDSQS
jgi:hypothetical protein